jgi:Flp pilus assembly protein CpaB
VIGGLLVTVAATGTFAVYASAEPSPGQPVVVVRRDIRAGERLDEADLGTELAALPPASAGRVLHDAADVIGAVALAPLAADEIVQRSAVALPSDGAGPQRHELTLPVERDRAMNGELAPGEVIDMLATYGTGETAHTEVVARGAEVIDATSASNALGSDERIVVHLAFASADEVIAATHAGIVATVTIVRTTFATDRTGTDRYPPASSSAAAPR